MAQAGVHGPTKAPTGSAAPSLPSAAGGGAAWPTPGRLLLVVLALLPVAVAVAVLRDVRPLAGILGVGAIGAVVFGLVRNHLRRLPWALLSAGMAVVAMADLTNQSFTWAFRPEATSTLSSVLPLAAYPLLIGGLFGIVRAQGPVRDTGTLIDSFVVTMGAGLLSWLYLAEPYLRGSHGTLLTTCVWVAHPVGDVLILCMMTRLVFSAQPMRTATVLLLVGGSSFVIADVATAWADRHGHLLLGHPSELGHLVFFLAWGAAALHPSMRDLVQTRAVHYRALNGLSLVALSATSFVAPILLLWRTALESNVPDGIVIGVVSTVSFLLLLLRLTSVTRQQALLATNEHILRDTGERLLAAADVEAMYEVALDAVAGLAATLTAAVLVSEYGPDGETVARARPHTLEQSAIRIDPVSASDGRARVTLPEGHAAHLGLNGLAWSAFALGENAGARRRLVVGLRRPMSSDAMAVVESIAVLVGLAVERIELARLVHERRSEARFRALVQNASDLILIARPDGRLVAETPSVSGVLGYQGEALSDLSITTLLEQDDVTRALALLQSMLAGHSSSPQRTEWRVRHAEGRTLVMEVVANDLLANRDVAGIALTMRDVTERKRLEDELRHRAFHDSLTNLANRALFNDRVQNAMNRSLRQHTSVAVLLLDLDDFKLVNDTFGHAAGDALLVEIGKRLGDVLRHGDTAARLGGDEFAVCVEFDDTRPDDATTLAQRILESFGTPIELEGTELMASATIGVAVDTASGCDAGELLRQADLALYAAKEAGKRTYRFYEPGLHAAALSRLERRNDLEAALSPSQFVVHYQPIVDLRSGYISAVEALVRWQHPERGLLPPSEFVDIAEETGLIIELGQWVLDQACQDLTRLRLVKGSDEALRMSVNVSPRQLREDGFVAMVDEVLGRNGLWPGELILEITESVLLERDDGVITCLEELDARGIALALDDFGTGYSSLSYLHQFPLRTIKIDRSFVQEMGTPNGEALVDSIVSMGRSLGLLQVAEGIEMPSQAAALIRLGCPYGQGMLFAPPLPVDDLTPLIGRRLLTAVAPDAPPLRLAAER